MAARLAPYLRYYASHRATDDHGSRPAVLVVFEDEVAASHSLRVARDAMDRAGAEVPPRIFHRRRLGQRGPLGSVMCRLAELPLHETAPPRPPPESLSHQVG